MTFSSELEKQIQLILALWLLFLLSPAASAVTKHSIHKLMTPSDLRSVFQVNSHQEVPEYDVTTIRVINKRSTDGQNDHRQVNLQAFGERMQLSLRPNVEFNRQLESLKLYTAQSGPENKIIYSEEDTTGSVGLSYHDDSKMAAVMIRQGPKGDILMVS